jgi:putative oxidoreductase
MLEKLNSLRPYALSLLRIISSYVFLLHGFQKALGMFGGFDRQGHTVPFATLTALATAGWIETICGPLLFLGLFSRPVAFFACGEMAVGYFRTHGRIFAPNVFPRFVLPLNNGGEPAVLLCFIFLYIVTAGPGPWSLDALIWKKKN